MGLFPGPSGNRPAGLQSFLSIQGFAPKAGPPAGVVREFWRAEKSLNLVATTEYLPKVSWLFLTDLTKDNLFGLRFSS